MSRLTLYRERCQGKRNAFLLLTLSGVIRPADVELPAFRDARNAGPVANATPQAEPSAWSISFRQFVEALFSKRTRLLAVKLDVRRALTG